MKVKTINNPITEITLAMSDLPDNKQAWFLFGNPELEKEGICLDLDDLVKVAEEMTDEVIDWIYQEVIEDFRPEGTIRVFVEDIPSEFSPFQIEDLRPSNLFDWVLGYVVFTKFDEIHDEYYAA